MNQAVGRMGWSPLVRRIGSQWLMARVNPDDQDLFYSHSQIIRKSNATAQQNLVPGVWETGGGPWGVQTGVTSEIFANFKAKRTY